MTLPAVLELAGFGVAYGERRVLREVSFSVPPSGATVLLGPSGTGKSTLLRTLAGYNRANAELRTWGSASYLGATCAPGNLPALVMQNSRLLVSDVLENLVCDLPQRASLTRRMQIDLVASQLEVLGQGWLMGHLQEQVILRPLVEQRLIVVLRQAVAGPPLLTLDEPTAGLGEADARRLLALARRLAEQRALLVVLHNLREARELADQVVLLAGGTVQEAQPAAGFFAAPASESGRHFLRTGSCPEFAPADEEAVPDPADAAAPPAPRSAGPLPQLAGAAPSSARGPRGFTWLLPGRLAGTPWPGIVQAVAYDLEALRSVGVTRLVSLTEEPFDPATAAPFGITCAICPMPDMHPPSLAQAMQLCISLDAWLLAGEVVAVHCRAGLGRTGTVLAAYWLWRAGGALGAVRALEDVRRLEPGWVQSQAQVSFLEEFARRLASDGVRRSDPRAATDGSR